jgi:hypothetical protein
VVDVGFVLATAEEHGSRQRPNVRSHPPMKNQESLSDPQSFRTRDLDELSNATPPMTTSFVPATGGIVGEVDAEAEALLLKLNVDEEGTTVLLSVDATGVVVDPVAVTSRPGRTYLLLANLGAPLGA